MKQGVGLPLHVRGVTVIHTQGPSAVKKLEHQHAAVYDGRFVYLGDSEVDCKLSLTALTDQEVTVIDGKDRWMLPGLGNTHTHMGMSLFRNASDDLALQEWLQTVIFPREAKLTPKDVYWGNLLSSLEMIRSGTTFAADMYFFADAAMDAAAKSGLRLNIAIDPAQKMDNGFQFDEGELLAALDRVKHEAALRKISIDLQMHSMYLYPADIYPMFKRLRDEYQLRIQTHIAETKREEEELVKQYGLRPVPLAASFGLLDGPVIAAHGVHLSDKDLLVYKKHGVVLSHNPASNLKLASGFANIKKALEKGVKVTLATDGPASNNSLDMYKEMYLASLLAKGVSSDPRAMPAWRSFQMASLDAYQAFDLDGGAIEVGKYADFQLLRTDDERFITDQDPASVLVYTLPKDLVDTVVVGGDLLYHKGEFTTLDEEHIHYEARQASRRLVSS